MGANHHEPLAGRFNLKQNPSVQVHYKESSLLHSLVQLYRLSGNASKRCLTGNMDILAVLKALQFGSLFI